MTLKFNNETIKRHKSKFKENKSGKTNPVFTSFKLDRHTKYKGLCLREYVSGVEAGSHGESWHGDSRRRKPGWHWGRQSAPPPISAKPAVAPSNFTTGKSTECSITRSPSPRPRENKWCLVDPLWVGGIRSSYFVRE